MGSYEHIILPDALAQPIRYSPGSKPFGTNIPNRNRTEHALMLQRKFEEVRTTNAGILNERSAVSLPTRTGTYIEFRGASNYDLMFKSLESTTSGIRLLNVRDKENPNGLIESFATVYIPHGKENVFLNKLHDYANPQKDNVKTTDLGEIKTPKNANLINSIEDISIAVLGSFWTDSYEKFPSAQFDWYEVWLKIDENADKTNQIENFKSILDTLNIEYKINFLFFPERAVILVYANQSTLVEILNSSEQLAELKKGQETAGFWRNENNNEQREWVEDLLNRLIIQEEASVTVCILDTGINNAHRLLSPVLTDQRCLTFDSRWGTADRDGHGTMMAGTVTYGDLTAVLSHNNSVSIFHKLCSVKILPNNESERIHIKELWGDITSQAIYKAEIEMVGEQVVYCMAVTTRDYNELGKPSSWSGAIDSMCYNDGISTRLMIISGGNIENAPEIWNNYPLGNSLKSIQSPAQAWNALTVGAYTNKVVINDPNYNTIERVAPGGGISPFSSTSYLWHKSWPIKPDIVFEGGNLIKRNHPDFPFDFHEDLEVLTTSKNFQFRQFETINATSAATAEAANLAAKIRVKYPYLWSESVRGLMVHSSRWTETMLRQFNVNQRNNMSLLLRSCGYGVPNIERALYSTENGFTYIAQNIIRPFVKNRKGYVSCDEMHFFDLPWPTELLESLGEVELTLRITLSYFIEPSPGEIGWKDKYRYQSFGLRFDVNNPNENEEQFKRRINKFVEDEEDDNIETVGNDSQRWTIGVNNRSAGTVHCDMISATGADLASCNMIAVFPVAGWWKTRKNLMKYNNRARYSLIVSLDTPLQKIDLYNIVKTKIETLIQTPIEVTIPIV